MKRLFLFDNFCVILKKLSYCLFATFFNICLEAISSYLTLGIIFIIFNFKRIRNKKLQNAYNI